MTSLNLEIKDLSPEDVSVIKEDLENTLQGMPCKIKYQFKTDNFDFGEEHN